MAARTLLLLMCVLCPGGWLVAQEAPATIHYVGFNHFSDAPGTDEEAVFTGYLDAVIPIMSRYGMTLQTFRVTHASGDAYPADAITVGTAPDRAAFAAFFADPDYQVAFPDLLRIIQAHTAVFTSGAVATDVADWPESPFLLTAYWFREPAAEGIVEFNRLQQSLSDPMRQYGVALRGKTAAVQANTGLGADVRATEPPQLLTIRSFRDPHGYFEDPSVSTTRPRVRALLAKEAAYWLKAWE